MGAVYSMKDLNRRAAEAESVADMLRTMGHGTITSMHLSLAAAATAQVAQWPQYAGMFYEPEWRVVKFVKDMRTKMGIAARIGDYTLAQWDDRALPGFDTLPRRIKFWSFRHEVATITTDASQLIWLEG